MNITIHAKNVLIKPDFDVNSILQKIDQLELNMSRTVEALQTIIAALAAAVNANADAVILVINELKEQLQAAIDAPTLEETNEIIAGAQVAIDALSANTVALIAAVDEANANADDTGGDDGDTGGDTGGDGGDTGTEEEEV
jgi:hypothetical protein